MKESKRIEEVSTFLILTDAFHYSRQGPVVRRRQQIETEEKIAFFALWDSVSIERFSADWVEYEFVSQEGDRQRRRRSKLIEAVQAFLILTDAAFYCPRQGPVVRRRQQGSETEKKSCFIAPGPAFSRDLGSDQGWQCEGRKGLLNWGIHATALLENARVHWVESYTWVCDQYPSSSCWPLVVAGDSKGQEHLFLYVSYCDKRECFCAHVDS